MYVSVLDGTTSSAIFLLVVLLFCICPMNTNPCGDPENADDGCGMVFPHRTPGGSHCPLCKKLKAPGLSPEAQAELKVSGSWY